MAKIADWRWLVGFLGHWGLGIAAWFGGARWLPGNRSGILGFTFLPSDDGKSAIVEYVAADRNAFSQLFADKSLVIFEKGKAKKADVEAALKKYRKDFSLDHFGAVVR